MNRQTPTNLELQIKVSKILSNGFVFSIAWLEGIGSLVAFVSGLRALIIIKRSNVKIHGLKMAWWCIIIGALGTIIAPFVIIFKLTKHAK